METTHILDLENTFKNKSAAAKLLGFFDPEKDAALPLFLDPDGTATEKFGRLFLLNIGDLSPLQRARIIEGYKSAIPGDEGKKLFSNNPKIPLYENNIPDGSRIVPVELWKSFQKNKG